MVLRAIKYARQQIESGHTKGQRSYLHTQPENQPFPIVLVIDDEDNAEVSAHWLRHTFATRYLAAHPGDLVGLARLPGHASLDTTGIYVQPTEEQLAQAVEELDVIAYV